MAENIVKLRVDSKEYEAKLDRARQGLLHLEQELQKVGQNFTHASKEQVQYVQQLGQMGTVSQTVRGKIGEMTKTFTELAVKYKQLSQEEKSSPFGQALSASLDQLRTRIQDSRQQLDEVTRSLSDTKQEGGATSGIMEVLKDKFTINIDAVKLFNTGLQAAEGALNVAKDAFFNNEEQLDEWGRVVESSRSLYTGFLDALNTGDISGYLSNIDQIVKAARDAYDALDTLGTYNAFNQINIERTRTNMTESIADYRGGKGSKDAVKAAGEAYKKELQDRKRMENDAYLAAIKRVAAERGVSAKDLTDALSGTYGHYQDLKKVQPTGVRRTVVGAGMFARIGTETFAQTRQEKLGEALRHLNDTELQSLQALGAQAQRTGTEIAQVDKQLTRVLNGRQPGAAGGSTTTRTPRSGGGGGNTYDPLAGSIDYQAKKVQELQKAWRAAADDDSRQKIKKQIEEAQFELEKLEGKTSGIPAMNYGLGDLAGKGGSGLFQDPLFKQKTYDSSNEFSKAITHNQWQLDDKAVQALGDYISKSGKLAEGGKTVADSWKNAASSIQSVGQALSSIDDPAAKVMGTIAQAVATIALTFAESLKGTFTPWDWIAAAATGTATMISTIAAIRSATAGGFANGGIVPGNSFSGDNLRTSDYGINSGELILNRVQQNTVASMLTQNREPIMLEAVVSAEQIQFVTGNRDRRRGRSEYINIR